VGLWHEQSREHRELWVRINTANIQPGRAHNFEQHISDGDNIGPYDYGSIMHYGPTDFGIIDPVTGNPMVTIDALQPIPPGVVMGQRNALSAGDIAAANILSQCPRLQSSIDTRKERIRDLQRRLHSAPPGEKPEIIAEIREQQAKLDREVEEFEQKDCTSILAP
jgi:hypothetical protein